MGANRAQYGAAGFRDRPGSDRHLSKRQEAVGPERCDTSAHEHGERKSHCEIVLHDQRHPLLPVRRTPRVRNEGVQTFSGKGQVVRAFVTSVVPEERTASAQDKVEIDASHFVPTAFMTHQSSNRAPTENHANRQKIARTTS